MYKKDMALNDLKLLICHKSKPNQNKNISMTHSTYRGRERKERKRKQLPDRH